MEPTKDELTRIFGAYIGCDCYDEYSDKQGVVQGVNKEYIWIKHNIIHDRAYNEVKLILTPLSEITAIHAEAIGRLTELSAYRREFWGCDSNNYLWIGKEIANGLYTYCGDILLSISAHRAIIDYLRSQHYDCGYGTRESLIETGIAISAVKNDEK